MFSQELSCKQSCGPHRRHPRATMTHVERTYPTRASIQQQLSQLRHPTSNRTTISGVYIIIIIIRPHRSTTYVDAAYSCRPSSVVCLSVCLLVCHTSEPCKNGCSAAQCCRYLIYSEADFEVFRPTGATRCTEIWHGGGDGRV